MTLLEAVALFDIISPLDPNSFDLEPLRPVDFSFKKNLPR